MKLHFHYINVEDIIEKVTLIKPDARVITSIQSQIDVMQILNTGLYKPIENKDNFWIETSKAAAEEKLEAEFLECCEKALSIDGNRCCKSKSNDGKIVKSDLSQVNI